MSEEDSNFVWDDSLLIKAYDDSVNLAREVLARRIADSTNRRAEENTELEKASKSPTSAHISEEMPNEFKVGDFARATYIDGHDYEGTIISINKETGTCILRYLGYENEQKVLMSELLASWGKQARRDQFSTAKQDLSEVEEERQRTKKKTVKTKNVENCCIPPGLRMPPAPPLPPMFNPAGGIDGELDQDLAAMLMAWYMSGYYTGLYHGKMQVSNKQKTSKK